MKITKVSMTSRIERTRNLPVTPDQIAAWEGGALIQNVMPHLSEDDREWLISGMTPEEWHEVFGEDDE